MSAEAKPALIDVGKLHCDALSCITAAPFIDQATKDRISNELTALVELVRARIAIIDELAVFARNPRFGQSRWRDAKLREHAALLKFVANPEGM